MPAPWKATHLYCGTSRETSFIRVSKICLLRPSSGPRSQWNSRLRFCLWAIKSRQWGVPDSPVAPDFREVKTGFHDSGLCTKTTGNMYYSTFTVEETAPL